MGASLTEVDTFCLLREQIKMVQINDTLQLLNTLLYIVETIVKNDRSIFIDVQICLQDA